MNPFPLESAIFLMNMAMEHVERFVFLNQIIETFEASVGKIFQIAIAVSRGMGHQNVKTIIDFQLPFQL